MESRVIFLKQSYIYFPDENIFISISFEIKYFLGFFFKRKEVILWQVERMLTRKQPFSEDGSDLGQISGAQRKNCEKELQDKT